MRLLAIISSAVRSLARAPIRSALTALGVVMGVAAVVSTLTIGGGARARVQETLSKPESRTVYISAMPPPSTNGRAAPRLSSADKLHPDDYYAIRNSISNISGASPHVYSSNARVQTNGRFAEASLEGIDTDDLASGSRRFLKGTNFSVPDVRQAANVCILNESLANLLFPEGVRADSTIRLNQRPFAVIGVVADIALAIPAPTEDLHVYLPFTTLLRRVDAAAYMVIALQARDPEQISSLIQRVRELMEKRRGGRKADFQTSYSFELVKTYAEGSLAVARLLSAVGAISLVVGGVGIMNIMLMSVAQRTREIGVRLALGTRRNDVLAQLLFEAVSLSLFGGIFGIVAGCTASWLVASLYGWPVAITPSAILIALVCSISVGIFFGMHPARQAAVMNPADALRVEN